MKPIANQFSSIEQITDQYLQKQSVRGAVKTAETSFEDILRRQQRLADDAASVKFSKHAASRLESRNISLTAEQSARLESGVERAEAKGINESLVLIDSLAFIVNVPNRTVVTAMDQNDTKSNIFTNIDGAVIM